MAVHLKLRQVLIQMLVIGFLTLWVWPVCAMAANSDNLHTEAEACYKTLLKNAKKQRYRQPWMTCIAKYEAVYRQAPNSSRAAASLYMSGMLYQELYKRSGRLKDKKEAVDIFERALKRYPQSPYRVKAAEALRALARTGPQVDMAQPAPKPVKPTLKADPKPAKVAQKTGANGQKHKSNQHPKPAAGSQSASPPKKRPADAAPSKPSEIVVSELVSEPKADRKKENGAIKKPVTAGIVTPNKTVKKVDTKTSTTTKTPVKNDLPPKKVKAPASAYATVTGLRYWSNPHYTRIVVDADEETTFKHKLLKSDPAIKKPKRLYIDLKGSRLGPNIKKTIPINDDLLIDARAGQYLNDTVRVVIDIKSYKTYNIFPLKNPFRIVVDMRGEEPVKAPVKPSVLPAARPKKPPLKRAIPKRPPKKGDTAITPGALAKQLSLGVHTVVIDPGHGGRDYGAPGYYKGVHEKQIALQIAKRLAAKIRKQLRFKVYLTRSTDKYLTLEERMAIANTKNADLFISIHTNSHKDRRATGIETYILNLAKDDESIRVAAIENATSAKNISDLQNILSDLMQHAKIDESTRLAGYVQNSLANNLKKRYSKIRNKGVKQAPFYVLLGAGMPSILIETSFISNPRECKRLLDSKYQDHLTNGIITGIRKYVHEIKPMALKGYKSKTRRPS